MKLGYRVILSWFCLLTSIVMLVLYLDGSLGNESIVIFIVPMIFNVVAGGSIFLKYLTKFGLTGPVVTQISGFKAFYLSVMLLGKACFEIMLCLKLQGIEIDTIYVFIPLWVFLILAMIYLLSDVVISHFKEHTH